MRFYYLCRREDVSNTSGTGHVAEAAEFDDGTVAVRWLASQNAIGVASTAIFNSLQDLLRVHGHQGKTVAELVADDGQFRKLRAHVTHLEKCLASAVALLEKNQIPVPEEFRVQSSPTGCTTEKSADVA